MDGAAPTGFARIDQLAGGAHLEQLSVHPDHGGRGTGRALLRAACDWAKDNGCCASLRARHLSCTCLNGPFYASEGFVEVGPVDEAAARGLPARRARDGPLPGTAGAHGRRFFPSVSSA